MASYTLKFPIEVDGKTITALTLRRPKGRDMVAIGDHIAALGRFYAANAQVLASAVREAAEAGAAAATASPGKSLEDLIEANVAAMTPPDASVYRAMVAVAAQLADLGDAAGDLDLVDLQEIAARAIDPGEAAGRGGAKTGAAQ